MTVIKCHYLDNPKKDEGQTSGSGNVTEGHCWNSSCRKVKSFGSLRVRTYTPALRARYGTARPLLWNHSFFLVVSNNLTWRVFAWRKLGLKILWCLKLIETSSFTHTSNVSSHFRILEYSSVGRRLLQELTKNVVITRWEKHLSYEFFNLSCRYFSIFSNTDAFYHQIMLMRFLMAPIALEDTNRHRTSWSGHYVDKQRWSKDEMQDC